MKRNAGTNQSAHSRTGRLRLPIPVTAGLALLLLPVTALAGTFAVMSYNVRGLPPQVIENRATQMALIAPLLEDFHTASGPYVGIPSVVGLQELFYQNYYNVLTNPATISYPYVTVKDTGGPSSIGDGLNMLSDFQIDTLTRIQWQNCFGTLGANGSDCDTNKGFTYSRVFVENNVGIDIYTLHADAGQDTGSRTARRANITQLVNYMNLHSPQGTAVIVFGDTNSLYTRVGNDNIQDLLTGTGVTDVWVQLRRSGIAPTAGASIESDCLTTPGTGNCELVDKVFYRDGDAVVLAPQSYAALKDMFSNALGADLSDHYPVAVTFDYATVTTTTTTTSTSSTSTSTFTTTTTLPVARPCGDPVALVHQTSRAGAGATALGRAVVAGDALYVLKVAVAIFSCPLCTCDVDNSGKVSASDALRVLKKAVGQNVTLVCPACG